MSEREVKPTHQSFTLRITKILSDSSASLRKKNLTQSCTVLVIVNFITQKFGKFISQKGFNRTNSNKVSMMPELNQTDLKHKNTYLTTVKCPFITHTCIEIIELIFTWGGIPIQEMKTDMFVQFADPNDALKIRTDNSTTSEEAGSDQ